MTGGLVIVDRAGWAAAACLSPHTKTQGPAPRWLDPPSTYLPAACPPTDSPSKASGCLPAPFSKRTGFPFGDRSVVLRSRLCRVVGVGWGGEKDGTVSPGDLYTTGTIGSEMRPTSSPRWRVFDECKKYGARALSERRTSVRFHRTHAPSAHMNKIPPRPFFSNRSARGNRSARPKKGSNSTDFPRVESQTPSWGFEISDLLLCFRQTSGQPANGRRCKKEKRREGPCSLFEVCVVPLVCRRRRTKDLRVLPEFLVQGQRTRAAALGFGF